MTTCLHLSTNKWCLNSLEQLFLWRLINFSALLLDPNQSNHNIGNISAGATPLSAASDTIPRDANLSVIPKLPLVLFYPPACWSPPYRCCKLPTLMPVVAVTDVLLYLSRLFLSSLMLLDALDWWMSLLSLMVTQVVVISVNTLWSWLYTPLVSINMGLPNCRGIPSLSTTSGVLK